MTDSRRSRLLAGVGVLIVVGAMVAAAAYFVRTRKGNTAEGRDNHGPPRVVTPPRPLTGVLALKPKPNPDNPGSEYWIYVDSQIVTRRLATQGKAATSFETYNIDLVPGRYTVEVALANPTAPYLDFPFRFEEAKEVSIEAGKTSEFEFAVTGNQYRGMQGSSSYQEGQSWPDWIDEQIKHAERSATEYRQDAAPSAMRAVYDLLSRSPPSSPTQYIEFPANYGGGRYFDSEQVRRIVSWLQRWYWDSWFPDANFFPGKQLPDDIPTDLRPTWDRLKAYMDAERAAIGRLEEIARMLDRLANDPS